MIKDNYDVIIVGAGPAGSTAAKFAALGGVSTLLLEKHPVIGYPLCCAEAISVTGLSNVVEPDARWISSKIERVELFGPNNSHAQIIHPDAGFVLERKIFDRALAEQAAANGADVCVGVDVTDLIFDSSGRLTGVIASENGKQTRISVKVIIAADGVESQIALKAGLPVAMKPNQMHSAYQYLLGGLDIKPETLEFHLGNKIVPGGYIWVFHKGNGLANVGLGICPTMSPYKKAKEYLDEFIQKRFPKYQILERMTGGVPSYNPDLPLFKDNLLLAGDAGRIIDSLTGAGIANALLSGKIAGQTAALMTQNGASGENYEKEFLKLKGKELKYYFYCRQIFLKLTDSDLERILKFADDLFGDREVHSVNPFEVIGKILLSHPRLLALGRHLIV